MGNGLRFAEKGARKQRIVSMTPLQIVINRSEGIEQALGGLNGGGIERLDLYKRKREQYLEKGGELSKGRKMGFRE